eukprot:s657_g2.t1
MLGSLRNCQLHPSKNAYNIGLDALVTKDMWELMCSWLEPHGQSLGSHWASLVDRALNLKHYDVSNLDDEWLTRLRRPFADIDFENLGYQDALGSPSAGVKTKCDLCHCRTSRPQCLQTSGNADGMTSMALQHGLDKPETCLKRGVKWVLQ